MLKRKLGNLTEEHLQLKSVTFAAKTSSSCQWWTGFKRVIFLWPKVFNPRYFHYKRHYQEMAQRPFQDENHTAVEEKVLQQGWKYILDNVTNHPNQNCMTTLNIRSLLFLACKYFRNANIGSIQIIQARCQRELQKLGRLVSRHRQISQGDPRLWNIKWQWW